MNTRDYKIFRQGRYYHVYNRGNNREDVFRDTQDFLNFLKRLKIALGLALDKNLKIRPFPENSFSIAAYCLMNNHFHLLIKQEKDIEISELIRKVGTSYAKYFNNKYKRIGNIFQDTFKAKPVDNDEYLMYLTAYIHLNPENPFDYLYSSLPEYTGARQGTLCNPIPILKYFENNKNKYKFFVEAFTYQNYQKIQHLVFEEEDD